MAKIIHGRTKPYFSQERFMEKVIEQMEDLGVNKQELTAAVQLKPSAFSRWVTGEGRLSADQVVGICDRLQMDPAKAAFAPRTVEFRLKGLPAPSMKTYSTRDKYLPARQFSLVEKVDFTPVKLIRDLAAGYGSGENFDIVEKAYVQGVPPKGYTVAQVRGDSMIATLLQGDFVLLKDFREGEGYPLPRIEEKTQKTPLKAWQEQTGIDHDDICVVDLGEKEGPTIKRVHYDTRRGIKNWKMLIVADNPHAWNDAWQVAIGDTVTFYGKLVSLCEKV